MNIIDFIMPHRLLLNKSLRKASQEFRDRVDAYQIEYDRKITECNDELIKAQTETNKQIEAFKASLIQELSDDRQLLIEIQEDVVRYTDCYFNRAYLYQVQDIKKKQNDILHEDYLFLTNQMKQIDNEIDLLRERQNSLSSYTGVDDIIRLAKLSGYDFDFKPNENAQTLLTKISEALRDYQGTDSVEKHALIRLKNIIQERSDYLPVINYIAWVIHSKIQYKKQLSAKRSALRQEQSVIRSDIQQTRDKIRTLTEELGELAVRVRYRWARPITYINADISYAYDSIKADRLRLKTRGPEIKDELHDINKRKSDAIKEIREKKSKRREVGSEIRSMKEEHSSDQWKWDSLQRESRYLTSEIESLSSEIDRYSSEIDSLSSEYNSLKEAVEFTEATISSKKHERKKWIARRTQLVNLIQRFDKSFRSNKKTSELDEKNIIQTRIKEIQIIREEGAIEAKNVYEQELQDLQTEHELAVNAFELRNNELKGNLYAAEKTCLQFSEKVSLATKELKKSQEEDKRFVLLKVLSESPEVTKTKNILNSLKEELAMAEEKRSFIEKQIDELESEIKAEAKSYEEKLSNCHPHPLRPTAEEQHEERKLTLRMIEIEQQKEETGHEGEN